MNYKQTTEYLFAALPSYQNIGGDAYKPGLERIANFCTLLGEPQNAYPVIHIAGTNGKGSTSNMLAAALQSAGYKVGLFTSPHLKDFRERIRVSGEMISQQKVVDFVAQHREGMEDIGLSFFEMTAALAFAYFADCEVDVAVIETGLGGRLDATNVVNPLLSVITNIGLDHTQYLGTTLSQIATEKAGIIKQNRAVVIGECGEECTPVIKRIAAEKESTCICAEEQFRVVEIFSGDESQRVEIEGVESGVSLSFDLDLLGGYQAKNLVCALSALEYINENSTLDIPLSAIKNALRQVSRLVGLSGRWQVLGREPLTLCDTGHNPHGLKEVTRQLSSMQCDKLYCVLGFANDKDLREILPLFPSDAFFIFVKPSVDRAFDVDDIVLIAKDLGLSCEPSSTVCAGVERAQLLAGKSDVIYIGGSTFVVAELDL